MISFALTPTFKKPGAIVLLTSEQKHGLLPKPLCKGECFPLIKGNTTILFVGLGKAKDLTLTALRIEVKKAVLSSHLKEIKEVELVPHDTDDPSLVAIIEGILIGTYTWDKYKSKKEDDKTVKEKHITLIAKKSMACEEAITICQGVNLTRDLINDNADTVTSEHLEHVVRGLIKGKKNIRLEVLNKKELKAKGMNLHLAVNQASPKEPKLIIVKYTGAKPNDPYTAIIGKGVTFDTGGLNIKPTGSMETMRTDMSGAGAVCGILKNTLALGLKKNVLFVLGIAENAIGSHAYKPGDVFTGYAGKSVEIGNTDAEGRLVLADAFAYVVKNYKPKVMVDLATLTGACVVALGFDYAGLFSNDDALARTLSGIAKDTDDRAWHMPIYPEIKEYIKSQVADLKNTSTIRGGGACTAAEFLHQFTAGTTWAHLDIAGVAYVDGACRFYYGHGATGAGVRLVTRYLREK